ncbi:MAG: hypothetical protein MZV63_13480 [Marinilabiliales bacterium]|nr:hypothetical protein [Marinilabiliales bacterium]
MPFRRRHRLPASVSKEACPSDIAAHHPVGEGLPSGAQSGGGLAGEIVDQEGGRSPRTEQGRGEPQDDHSQPGSHLRSSSRAARTLPSGTAGRSRG